MRVVPRPLRDPVADLDACIRSAREPRKARLVAHRQDAITLFDNYVNHGAWHLDRADDIEHLSSEVRAAFLLTYTLTYPRRVLRGLRADLLSLPDNLCPYCRLEVPTTLDHFLPKSRHQLFASFAPNLVPMCSTCNTLKGTKGSAVARQFFTHAYFDELAAGEKFLVAQVAVGAQYVATNFAIDFSARLDADVFQRLAYQFSILRLGPRYQLEAVDVIAAQAIKLEEMAEAGCTEEDRRHSLEGDAASECIRSGASYWKAALLVALSNSTDFCADGFRVAL